jgi:hypothetical protein
MTRGVWSDVYSGRHALAAGIALTLLAAWKPVVIDEAIYLRYAAEFAAHPADPYGFEVLWYDVPEPADTIVVPPVIPYWLALAGTLLGQGVAIAKLSLLPFALAFTFGLAALLRRFAPGCAAPLLWMTVLSPAVLPGFGLMLDVPTLGLSLAALAIFVVACERRDVRLAVAAGVISGVAAQTKYTGATCVALMGAWALIFRRPVLGAVAALCAAAVFIGWEWGMHALYGQSHFLHGMSVVDEMFGARHGFDWPLSFVGLVGAVLPTVGLLALASLWPARRVLVLGAAGIAMLFAVVGLVPPDSTTDLIADFPVPSAWRPELYLYAPMGTLVAIVVGALAAVEARSLVRRRSSPERAEGGEAVRATWRWDAAALAWLVIELVGFWVLSPFPAARRVIGLGLALTVLSGRVASRAGSAGRRAILFATGATAALGLFYLIADYSDAFARREAVGRVVDSASGAGCETTWYAGHWGFGYYAEHAGLRAAVPGQSRLEPGDCFAYPIGVYKQRIVPASGLLSALPPIDVTSDWPWRTIPSYYVGPVPLRAQAGVSVRVLLFRVVGPWVPRHE